MMLTMLITLPTMLVCWHRYFSCKKEDSKITMILYKCTATLMCVVMALAGAVRSGAAPLLTFPFWGALFCMLGDGLLEVRFLVGMAAFGAGHLVWIGWISGLFAATNGVIGLALSLWLCAFGASVWVFRGHLKTLGKRMIAFLLYDAVLMAMAAMALLLPVRLGISAWNIAVGGLLFAVSDLFVAKGLFDGLSPAWDRFALGIYYAAVYLLAMGNWIL